MKQIAVIIIGFIAGLAISGVLGDLIVVVSNSVGRISSAWSVSQAEREIAGGNFLQAQKHYEKALQKIDPQNKKLLAKTKNNYALAIYYDAAENNDAAQIEKSREIFKEALMLYEELGDEASAQEVEENIKTADAD